MHYIHGAAAGYRGDYRGLGARAWLDHGRARTVCGGSPGRI